jgi:murein DD-endopeptidase MepM/ murein hydrolase activator NlpD
MRRKTLKWIAGSMMMILLQIPFVGRDVPLLVFRLFSASPLACGTVTSGYGLRLAPIRGGLEFHDGVDLAAPEGTPIAAIAEGTVAEVGFGSGYGNYIVLQHGCNVKSLYAHCSTVFAQKGDEVKRGEVIAAVGSTGLSTGSHLHLQIEYRGRTIPPRRAVRD